MKKRCLPIVVLLMLLLLPVWGNAVESGVDTTQKVYDYAGLFTQEQTGKLQERCKALAQTTNNDIVILTISSNDTASTLAYAEDFYDYNGFGVGAAKDGILLIIDMDNRMLQTVTTGKGSQSSAYTVIDPQRLSAMEDDIYRYLTAKDYYGGATSFLDRTEKYFTQGADTAFWNKYNSDSNFQNDLNLDNGGAGNVPNYAQRFVQKLPFGAFFGLVIAVLIVCILRSRNKTVALARAAAAYEVPGSFIITASEDTFVSTHTSVTPIQQSSGSSGGGGGFHTGSSGTSHGTGGGRSF